MKYVIDYDYEFETDEDGLDILPTNLTKNNGLYVLPNGKYLPSGIYSDGDSTIIYEPWELSPFKELFDKQKFND